MRAARLTKRDASDLFRMCVVNGSLDEGRARQVVDGVIESGHSAGPAILSRFVRLLRLDSVRRSARVESAAPLDADLRTEVEQGLTRKYGNGITTAFVVDPSLVGGMRLRIGSDVYDGSVKAELAALEARL
jgi:F-type H+-transporting ATPase subunit delta